MSGIIGIASTHNTVTDLLHSLQRMEQASHNSCGLVVHGRQGPTTSPPRLHRHRRAQRPSVWIEQLAESGQPVLNGLQGQIGMGYTGHACASGATGPKTLQHTLQNIWPHMSHGPHAGLNSPARVAVVVHGQVHASAALRDALHERGYRFTGQSDAELLAHLMDATYQNDPVQAVQRALALLTGAVSVGVLFHDQPQRLIAAQSGIPLWLASDGQTTCVTSDLSCLPAQARHITALSDGDVLDLHHDPIASAAPSLEQTGG
ncbi:MAG: hypothetical protein AAB176_02650 [Pseudomonadota bacterium]|jgi:glucosamine--fructose-6-phosphate aminotransferase (isomerizing)